MKSSVLVLLTLFCLTGFAADPPTTESAKNTDWMKYSTPGEGHKALAPLAGNWKYTAKFWMKPTEKPEESKGTSKTKWVMGGRFLQQEVKGKAMGKPFNGMGFTGFDTMREQYQTVWLDDMSTHMMLGSGTFDTAANTLKQSGEFSCAMSGDKNRWYRTDLKITDKNSHTYAMYTKGEDGNEFKSMEITYTRSK